uniref:Prostacyclin synthase n=1 Tax=Salarias fasciatus TaxID=181472 RepID=A0A672ISF1_SALFA
MTWTTLLLMLLLLLVLLFFTLTRRSRYREPPLDKGIIPWLGHALEFGRDAAKFLTRMKLKHGNIFTVRAAGRYVTVLLDPHSYDAVLGDSECLDFTRYAQVLMDRIFNLQLPLDQHFLGMNAAALDSIISRHLRALLKAKTPTNQKDWKEEGLFHLCYSLLFKAGYLTLFGGEQNNNGADPSSVYDEYKKFDGLLTKMARGTLRAGRDTFCYSGRRQRKTDLIVVLICAFVCFQGNVGPAAFWLLGHLLTNPEALTAVKKEFSQISQMETTEIPFKDKPVDTPVFDSALQEALRLTAAPFITREVVQEKSLRMADGQEYLLRKGDRVCLFPFISPQMDPEVYHEPQKFKHNRFLNEDGSVKENFYKGGRRLKYYTMPWGAGTNGCVGKQFAINTIRQFVYKFLTSFDLELCDPNASVPEINASRYGFGMLQPDGDLLVRYKPKNKD